MNKFKEHDKVVLQVPIMCDQGIVPQDAVGYIARVCLVDTYDVEFDVHDEHKEVSCCGTELIPYIENDYLQLCDMRIAAACGWRRRLPTKLEKIIHLGLLKYVTTTPKGIELCGYLPKYHADLNCCFDAEEQLVARNELSDRYEELLRKSSCLWHASAKQRALALHTIIMEHWSRMPVLEPHTVISGLWSCMPVW